MMTSKMDTYLWSHIVFILCILCVDCKKFTTKKSILSAMDRTILLKVLTPLTLNPFMYLRVIIAKANKCKIIMSSAEIKF